MAGYTRQDTANNISNGSIVDADDLDAEFNQAEAAFNATTGHKHDGSAGEGAPITKVGPAQDLIVSATAVTPKTTNTLDLGSAAVQFKDAHFDGTVNTDILTVDQTATLTGNVTASADLSVGGNLTVTGNATINGNLTFGDAATDTVAFGADINSNIVPDVDNAYDLGSSTQEWRNLYIDGTANIDSLVADTVDINSGTIDGTVIGGTSAAAITGTTISSTSGFSGNLIGDVTGTVSSLANHDTGDLAEGTNLYYTNTRARAAISGVDAGGDGSFSYNSTTGAFTYTGPSATEVRSHFSAGTGVAISNGQVSIGQSVATTANPTFNDLTITGNLTVSGTTTTVNTETVYIADNQIVLNSNYTGSTPTENGGIEIERGTLANKTFVWDEAADKWTVGSETFVAGTVEATNLKLNGTTVTSTAAELNILDGVTATAAEINILDGVTATAAEINKLDGVTATTAELNKLAGLTATTAELNILGGVTATAAEINKLDGVTATTTELNYVDGVTSNIQTQLDSKRSASQVLTLSGDVSGSGTTSIVVTVADDSHNHVISNVDGLQTTLDAKLKLPNTSWTNLGTVTSTDRVSVTRGDHIVFNRTAGTGDFTISVKTASSGGSDIANAIMLGTIIYTTFSGTGGGYSTGFYILSTGYIASTAGNFTVYRTT